MTLPTGPEVGQSAVVASTGSVQIGGEGAEARTLVG
jgi:hypothetical protein